MNYGSYSFITVCLTFLTVGTWRFY